LLAYQLNKAYWVKSAEERATINLDHKTSEEKIAWDLVNGQQGMTAIEPSGTEGSDPNKLLSDPIVVSDGNLATFWLDTTDTASKLEF
jgi:hypothetical protein